MTSYFLGLDVATNITGWAIGVVENTQLMDFDAGHFNYKHEAALPKRLHLLSLDLLELKSKYPFEPILFKEQSLHLKLNKKEGKMEYFVPHQNQDQLGMLYKAHGVVESVFHDFKVIDLSITEIKKRWDVIGGLKKEGVQQGVRQAAKLPASFVFNTYDESDAGGALLLGLEKSGIVAFP